MAGDTDPAADASGSDPDWPEVLALQAGDDAALDVLMGRYQERLFRFAYRYVLNHATAADLVQETFVRAYFKIGQFQPGARFAAWLYRIALNLCRDHARSPAAKAAARTDAFRSPVEPPGAGAPERGATRQEPLAPGQSPSEAVVSAEEMRRLRNTIDTLPHDLKTALILCALENRSQKECAELLGTTPKTVETRLARARRLLREKLRPAR